MATLGYMEPTAFGGGPYDGAVYLLRVTLEEAGVFPYARVYFNSVLAGDDPDVGVAVAVYQDAAGEPTALIATSFPVVGVTADVETEFLFAEPVSLAPGAHWIGVLAAAVTLHPDTNTPLIEFAYADTADIVPVRAQVSTFPSPPDPLGTPYNSDTNAPFVVYLTDEPIGAEEPEPEGGGLPAQGASGVPGGGSYGGSEGDAFSAGTGGGDADDVAGDGQLKRSGIVGGGGYS